LQLDDHRKNLLAVYQAAIAAVEGRLSVAKFLRKHHISGSIYLVAIGKAAASMARGAYEQLGNAIPASLIITRHGYGQGIGQAYPGLRLIEAGHPIPDRNSLAAGDALLEFVQQPPPDTTLLFLLSGGASSVVEVLPDGVSLAEIQRVNQWLLASGLPIHEINRVRKSLSCIKGGRLASALPDRPLWNLLISDVPGDDVSVIGSGLLAGASDPISDATMAELPGWLVRLLNKVPPDLSSYDSPALEFHTSIVATSRTARRAAEQSAQRLGYPVHRFDGEITGDVIVVAAALAQQLKSGPPGLYVWGGETTVRLPPNPGQGGRCQHLALHMARLLQLEWQQQYLFLAAGTDGSDGPGDTLWGIDPAQGCTGIAGALIDGSTIQRGIDLGLDVTGCLQQADAGRFLDTSGDLFRTGVTGTNVMDLMLGLKA